MAKGFRIVLLMAVTGAIVTLGAGVLLAADGGWTAVPFDKNFRGPGGYLSWIRSLPVGCYSSSGSTPRIGSTPIARS